MPKDCVRGKAMAGRAMEGRGREREYKACILEEMLRIVWRLYWCLGKVKMGRARESARGSKGVEEK